MREDQYLEAIYGVTSRIENKLWMQKMCKDAKWIFDSAELRKRLMNAAEVKAQHF